MASQGGTSCKDANAGDIRDVGFIPGSGRSPAGGKGNQLQYFFLGNSTNRGTIQGDWPWGHKELDTTEHLSKLSLILFSVC